MFLNKDLFDQVLPTIPLVYRKRHKSTEDVKVMPPSKKGYDLNTFVSISPRKICTYLRNTADNRIHDAMQHDYLKAITPNAMPISNKHQGTMSYKASHQINDKIDWMLLITKEKDAPQQKFQSDYKWKINMLTVSLASKQIHNDKTIKHELLNHYLLVLHRTFNVTNYIWRAESQGNGNIHFHIITDVFIPYKAACFQWNKVQEKLGYISRFQDKHGSKTPNSTDIKSIRKVKSLGRYLSKYMGKNSAGVIVPAIHKPFVPPVGFYVSNYKCKLKKGTRFFRPIFGRLWGCSAQLSSLKKCRFRMTDEIEKEIYSLRLKHPSTFRQHDYCRTYDCEVSLYKSLGLWLLRGRFYEYYKEKIFEKKRILKV